MKKIGAVKLSSEIQILGQAIKNSLNRTIPELPEIFKLYRITVEKSLQLMIFIRKGNLLGPHELTAYQREDIMTNV